MEINSALTRTRPARHRKTYVLIGSAVFAVLAGVAATAIWIEAQDSGLQARYFNEFARDITWQTEAGANASLWLPQSGPYNSRLGYSQMQTMLPRLTAAGYEISAQARQSERFQESTGYGLYPIYRAKSQAGLSLLDRNQKLIYGRRFPERQYTSFDEIPPVLVNALLYVENRNLLEPGHDKRNPAVDWGRLSRAALGHTLRGFGLEGDRGGGSTLATQIEKFRHSPGGRTRNADDKLRQMVSASLRAYQDGEDTLAARQRIVLTYLNSVPLAGLAGYGEVNGLGDGLWAWYGRDFDEANRLLADPDADPKARAQVFREVMSLIVAQRRPSGLLLESKERLDSLTDSYLRLLSSDGGIPETLRDNALQTRLTLARKARESDAISFVERKAVNGARSGLGELLGVEDLYALDRYDLEAHTTLDAQAQARVTAYFSRLLQPSYLACAGFREPRLLNRGNPSAVNYSFTLYETTPDGNLLRVQADNLNQPLDINAGTKLDLGSSAKFRTRFPI